MRLTALTAIIPFPASTCSMIGYQTVEAKGLASSKLQAVGVTECFKLLTFIYLVALFTHDAVPNNTGCLARGSPLCPA